MKDRRGRQRWEGRVRGTGRSRGRENHNQSKLHEKSIFQFKKEEKHITYNILSTGIIVLEYLDAPVAKIRILRIVLDRYLSISCITSFPLRTRGDIIN